MVPKVDPSTWPAILTIQPRPVQTLVASLTARDGESYTMVVRRWAASDLGRCQLCRQCSAKIGPDRSAVCIVAVNGDLAEDEAPLYAQHDS